MRKPAHRDKTRFVPQSSPPIRRTADGPRRARTFDVAVVAHLRDEKDPLRAAIAARSLPSTSRVRVVHAGRALTDEMRDEAIAERRGNPRYAWLGELSPPRARALIGGARLMVLSSRFEGGANVLSEAIAAGTPVLASRIDCALGLLGDDYPGLFEVGATDELARLLRRAEESRAFLADLARRTRARRAIVSATAERTALRRLAREVGALARSLAAAPSSRARRGRPPPGPLRAARA